MWSTRWLLLVLITIDVVFFIAFGALNLTNNSLEDFDIGDGDGDGDSADAEFNESSMEKLGAVITQITKHPYAASLLQNDSHVCSAVILNRYWLITNSKCFAADMITSYVAHRNLKNYTVRVGSSYNNKGGSISQIRTLVNNFDVKVSAMKVMAPLKFSSKINAVRMPVADEELAYGYLASSVAWTPNAHIRLVNMPVIRSSICDPYTKLQSGLYICVGGVVDGKRHFCRRDSGGAIIQNNTLIAITAYVHSCADYTRTHAFPRVSSFTKWINAVIWDEESPPKVKDQESTPTVKPEEIDVTETTADFKNGDTHRFAITFPFDPINVPLEPGQDNYVIPRMSIYESYLHNMAKAKTSIPVPLKADIKDHEWVTVVSPKAAAQYPKSRYEYNYVRRF